jgi:pSer/pThr/pTyr-binding forkhead associated (FHA) protein
MATIVLKLRGRELSRHPVTSRIVRLGRDVTNDITIDNSGVSRVHASVRYTGGAFHVVDEGSANGIFVNGTEVDIHLLEYGDEIQFGKFTAVFLAGGGAAPQDLDDGDSSGPGSVNPVETTSISIADLRRMIAARATGATPQIDAPPPLQAQGHRHSESYDKPPMTNSDVQIPTPPPRDSTQQLMLLAIGALGATVFALGCVVMYLLLRN